MEIRKNGTGNGFTVINPHDGYRKDNRLWFGECSECGEQVVSSLMSAKNTGWTHEIRSNVKYHDSGNVLSYSSISVDYCPKA